MHHLALTVFHQNKSALLQLAGTFATVVDIHLSVYRAEEDSAYTLLLESHELLLAAAVCAPNLELAKNNICFINPTIAVLVVL